MPSLEDNKLIDELKEKLHQFENILALMPGHVYWLDRANVYQGCNNLQAKAAQLSSPKEIIGKKNRDMIWKEHAEELDRINLRVMESGIPIITEEQAIMSHGPGIYLSHKVPMHDQQGKVIGLVGISFDITERKRMENELREAKEQAEIANQAKADFLRNMEHDIRTPFVGIQTVASYLKSIETDPHKNDFLKDIESASQELLNFFNEVIEFCYIESGHVPIIEEKFNLKQLIQNVLSMEQPAASGKHLSLSMEYADHLPSLFMGDKFRIQRIMINLISNAIKFTHQGFVKIIIDSARQIAEDKKNIHVQIKIADSGIGFPLDRRNFLYETFTRGDLSNRGIYKGNGLGLRIVKQFINELNASIEIQSKKDEGTIFTCTIPLKRIRRKKNDLKKD